MLCEYSWILIVLSIFVNVSSGSRSPTRDYKDDGVLLATDTTRPSIGRVSDASGSTRSLKDECTSTPRVVKCKDSGGYWFFNYSTRRCVALRNGDCIEGKYRYNSIADCQRVCSRFMRFSSVAETSVTSYRHIRSVESRVDSGIRAMLTPLRTFNISERMLDKDPCYGRTHFDTCDYGSYVRNYTLFRYAFVPGSKRCHKVEFSGCRSYENLFDDSNDCKSSCEYRLRNTLKSTRCQGAYISKCVNHTSSNESSHHIRYHYSSSSNRCVVYNSVDSQYCLNQFFTSQDDCHRFCRPKPATEEMLQNKCFGEVVLDSKSCSMNQRSPLWFHMAAIGQCLQYLTCPVEFGGNVFHTKSQCEDSCLATNIYKVCSLQMDPGKGSEVKFKYYFDNQYRKCRVFQYRGSLGNLNRFRNYEECLETCGRLKPSVGVVINSRSSQASALVDKLPVGGQVTLTTSSNVTGLDQDTGTEYCLDVPSLGLCKYNSEMTANTTKYAYNKHIGRCEPLKFWGCGPISRNTFDFLSLCEKMCTIRIARTKSSMCARTISWCSNSSWIYWRYNGDRGLCELFPSCTERSFFDDTLFTEEAQCTLACVPPLPRRKHLFDVCHLPPTVDQTQCSSPVKRWFYQAHRRICEESHSCINYGNNFASESLCMNSCEPSRVQVTCQYPGDRGPCSGNQTMYHYDWSTRRCMPFSYGGCLGNRNRFASAVDCEVMCGAGVVLPATILLVILASLAATSLTMTHE